MKWHGVVGYTERVQDRPGIWVDKITERRYKGDVIRVNSRWTASTDSTNDDLTTNNQLSIVADPFAYQNFQSIKYVEFMGAKWKVTSADPQRPRIILTLGGAWNG